MGWIHYPQTVGVGDLATRDWYSSPVVSVHEWIDEGRYVVSGDLRGYIISTDQSNHEARDRLREITDAVPDLKEAIDYDSEYSCFFANTRTLGAAQALVGIILGLRETLDDSARTVIY